MMRYDVYATRLKFNIVFMSEWNILNDYNDDSLITKRTKTKMQKCKNVAK